MTSRFGSNPNLTLEHFHQSGNGVPSLIRCGLFRLGRRFGSIIPIYRDAFTEALPKSKNPRSPSLHLFGQLSGLTVNGNVHIFAYEFP